MHTLTCYMKFGGMLPGEAFLNLANWNVCS